MRLLRPLLLGLIVLLAGSNGLAQSYPKEEKGFVIYEAVEGSSNSFGQVIRWDSSVGYNFKRYFAIDVGVPVYFVVSSGSSAPTAPRGRPPRSSPAVSLTSTNGLGNVYADVNFTLERRLVNYAFVLTGTAPTGDTASGLSTGRVTVDWTNRFDRTFGRVTPFADLGIANTVSDAPFFVRPFSSLGFVSHFEAGAAFDVWKFISLGASAYDVLPAGQQKIFSRFVHRPRPGTGAATPQVVHHRPPPPFANSSETVGGASLDRDNGFAAWLDATPWHFLDLEAGYTRSVRFRLDTVFFFAGANVSALLRKAHHRARLSVGA